MRRVVVVVASAAALVMPVAPAFATVHPLSCSEVSNAPAGTAARTQDPPGLTGGSSADNFAQPVVSVSGTPGADDAFKPEGC
jgi:hypothetical protein